MPPCDSKKRPESPVTTFNHSKVTVYPNPTRGRVQIRTNEIIKELYISDFTGKVLERITAGFQKQVLQIDLSRYPSGTYLVRYFTEQRGWGSEKVLLIK